MSTRAWLWLGVTAVLASCKHEAASLPPGQGFGCIEKVSGNEMACLELDALATDAQALDFGKACTTPQLKSMTGRLIAHCRIDHITAECALPAERSTRRFYSDQMNADKLRGAAIGCKLRGGTFTPRP